jgi:peptide/nickel transport system permease protein
MSENGTIPPKSEKERLRQLRRRRIIFHVSRFKKTWDIYYKNSYGKIGFYILLFFVIVTLLSPVLILHKDSSTYIAPTIDTTIPNLLSHNYVGNDTLGQISRISSYGSSATVSGSNYVYTINSNGQIRALKLLTNSSNTTGEVYNVTDMSIGGSVPISMSVFTLVQSVNVVTFAETLSNYILVATSSGIINLTRISDINSNGALTAPHAVIWQSMTLHNSSFVLPPISSVLPIDQSNIPSIPFYSASSSLYGSGSNVGRIFAVTESTTNSSYYLTEIMDSGLSVAWTEKLPISSPPTGLKMYGSFFTYSGGQLVILTDRSSMYAYRMDGSLAWQSNITGLSFTGNMFVPQDYQRSPRSYNSILAVANGSSSSVLYAVNASSGEITSIFNSSSPLMTAVTSSPGSQGFPSTVASIVGNDIYVLSGPNHLEQKLSLASGVGAYKYDPLYDPLSDTFIISTSTGGLYSLSRSLGNNPFTWGLEPSASMKAISQPALILNAATGLEAITFRANNGYVYVYSGNGKVINPIPPTFHAPSGNIYPLGTNSAGNDVWSQFIASFSTDWLVGILVGLVGIAVAVIFGIFIGYYRGFISVALDTITLTVYLIPFLALLIALTSVVKPSLINVVWILSFTGWPFITFTILGIIRSLKQRLFVDAAKISGARTFQIMRRHVMPNILPLLTYLISLSISGAIGAIATLQFLGLVPITIQTWGAMLNPLEQNFYLAATAPWWVLPPTIALTLFVMGFIFVSRGVDEVVNPRLRRR